MFSTRSDWWLRGCRKQYVQSHTSATVKWSTTMLYKLPCSWINYCKALGHGAGRDPVSKDGKSHPGIDIEINQEEVLCLPCRKGTDVIILPQLAGWLGFSWHGTHPGLSSPDAGRVDSQQQQQLGQPCWSKGPACWAHALPIPATVATSSRTRASTGRLTTDTGWRLLAELFCPLDYLVLLPWWLLSGVINIQFKDFHTLYLLP